MSTNSIAERIIQHNALPININFLLKSIGNIPLVSVGDDTHGTVEFYEFRAELTKRLILEKGFTLIGVEWDWIDINRINNYILGQSNDRTAQEAVSPINRFPEFMYDNHPFTNFVEWLRQHNNQSQQKVTIYGLDIFGLPNTARYLQYYLPEQRELLDPIVQTLAQFQINEYDYGYAVRSGKIPSLEKLVRQIQPVDNYFLNEAINLLRESENYYRRKVYSESDGWNLRDSHMARIIESLMNQYNAKMVCWLHNTHTGDAQAVNEFEQNGKISAMTLLRQRFGFNVFSIGLISYTGTVTASNRWYGPTLKFQLRPAVEGSISDLFHDAMGRNFMLIFREADGQLLNLLNQYHLQRFVGGAYNPESELQDHYVNARIYPQYDAIIFFDYTNAIN